MKLVTRNQSHASSCNPTPQERQKILSKRRRLRAEERSELSLSKHHFQKVRTKRTGKFTLKILILVFSLGNGRGHQKKKNEADLKQKDQAIYKKRDNQRDSREPADNKKASTNHPSRHREAPFYSNRRGHSQYPRNSRP